MFPSTATLCTGPAHAGAAVSPGLMLFAAVACAFSDEQLYQEQAGKSAFFAHDAFFGVDLTPLRAAAHAEYLRQPVIEHMDARQLVVRAWGRGRAGPARTG